MPKRPAPSTITVTTTRPTTTTAVTTTAGTQVTTTTTTAPTTTQAPTTTMFTTTGPCTEYICPDGSCIDFEEVCDGTMQCPGGEDEDDCGGWTSWGPWGDCSETCDSGIQTRTRLCTDPPPPIDDPLKYCHGNAEEQQECFVEPCPESWGPWSRWSECTNGCLGDMTYRVRMCRNRVGDGMPQCINVLNATMTTLEYKMCNRSDCQEPECVENSEWLEADECKTCPGTCLNLWSQEISSLVGQVAECLPQPCEPGCYCKEGFVEHNGTCIRQQECPCFINGVVYDYGDPISLGPCETCYCINGTLGECVDTYPCNVDCEWSEWTSWGPVVGPCGTEVQQYSYRYSLKLNSKLDHVVQKYSSTPTEVQQYSYRYSLKLNSKLDHVVQKYNCYSYSYSLKLNCKLDHVVQKNNCYSYRYSLKLNCKLDHVVQKYNSTPTGTV
ncbi:SCO-spondin-like [Branchiostoma floridae x Branchiostoma japonicum]